MLDDHVRRPNPIIEDLKDSSGAAPPRAAHVVEQVVPDEDPLHGSARVGIVGPQDADPRSGVADDVADERHVLDRGPGSAAVLVADRQLHREAGLVGEPDVLQNIALHQHPPGVFQLEEVLDAPLRAGIARIALPPRERFEEVVVSDVDVGGHQVADRGIGATEHDVLAGSFQMVVDDLEGTGPVPAHDGLGVGAGLLEIGQVGIDDREGLAVQRDAPPAASDRIAVQVAAIDDDVVRQHRVAGLLPRPELHQAVDESAGLRSDLDADEPEMMSARRRLDHGAGPSARYQLRHHRGVRPGCPRAGRGQAGVGCSSAHRDPARSSLLGQRERAPKRRPGLEGNHVPGLRSVERGLDVAAGGDGDRAAGRSRISRVHRRAGTLGLGGPDRSEKQPQPGCRQNATDERAMREPSSESHASAAYAARLAEINCWRPSCPGSVAIAPASREAVRG